MNVCFNEIEADLQVVDARATIRFDGQIVLRERYDNRLPRAHHIQLVLHNMARMKSLLLKNKIVQT